MKGANRWGRIKAGWIALDSTKRLTDTPAVLQTPLKSINEVADEIMRRVNGWGDNPGRHEKLTAYGGEAFAADVQRRVNLLMQK